MLHHFVYIYDRTRDLKPLRARAYFIIFLNSPFRDSFPGIGFQSDRKFTGLFGPQDLTNANNESGDDFDNTLWKNFLVKVWKISQNKTYWSFVICTSKYFLGSGQLCIIIFFVPDKESYRPSWKLDEKKTFRVPVCYYLYIIISVLFAL